MLAPAPCAACGKPVLKRRRRHCDDCIPGIRAEHAKKVVAVARKALAQRAAAGVDPRKDPKVNRRRGAAISESHRHNREWNREHRGDRNDGAWFRREILRKLDTFPLSAIASATGLSLAACSRIRSGKRVPHPRHWGALLALVER
jgi:hypothetical protein